MKDDVQRRALSGLLGVNHDEDVFLRRLVSPVRLGVVLIDVIGSADDPQILSSGRVLDGAHSFCWPRSGTTVKARNAGIQRRTPGRPAGGSLMEVMLRSPTPWPHPPGP